MVPAGCFGMLDQQDLLVTGTTVLVTRQLLLAVPSLCYDLFWPITLAYGWVK